MKLMRIGPAGEERPAISVDGVAYDLSSVVPDINAGALTRTELQRISAVDVTTLPALDAGSRIGPCVAGVGKFICVGLNYVDHATESNLPIPSEPILFMKATSAICGPNDRVILPRDSAKGDWEVELGIVIGEKGTYIAESSALDHVAGYCVVNDVSERSYQIERGGQWTKGKSFDTFGPIGPCLVTPDEVPDPQSLRLWLDVDGKRYQDGNTANMIFGVARLISYISNFMTLHPGDIISTGTPAGVGMGIKPKPVFLAPGMTMRLGIEGLGEQQQTVGRFA